MCVRQGYEDWLRHKADNSVNQCPVHIVQHGKVVRKQSRKLMVRSRVCLSTIKKGFCRVGCRNILFRNQLAELKLKFHNESDGIEAL